MTIFSLVFFKVLSSLLSVVLGYCSGRFSNVQKESIASLLFYFVAPIVFFAIPTSAKLSFSDLGVTAITTTVCAALSFFSYWLYGKFWQDSHRNLLALSAGTGNTGYVVLPIATALFDDRTLSLFAFGLIGVAINEASFGCYFCARSVSSMRESALKVVKLPILNAFFIGCLFSLVGFQMPEFLDEFIRNMKGAFSILGMVLIGLALSQITEFRLDLKFTFAAFLSKFVFFPLAFSALITFDKLVLHWYDDNYYDAWQLISLAPMATNTIVMASLFKIYPEKMATTVLLSLLFVLIYLPIMATIFLQVPK